MLKNDALDAKIGVDTAANEPRKGSEILKTRKNGRPITEDRTVMLLKFSARKTLKNDSLLAKIAVDTARNKPPKGRVHCHTCAIILRHTPAPSSTF